MKLYMVLSGLDYEGDTPEGVFSSRELALAFVQSRSFFADSVSILETTLDEPIEDMFRGKGIEQVEFRQE